MRKFEKISFEQFKKDVCDDLDLYNEFQKPSRETFYAAGYDFFALYDFVIKPGEITRIPTGIKVYMEDDEVLLIAVRSSMGYKYNVRLVNQVGVIDKDYCDNPTNEGHIWIKIQNEGKEDYVVKKGDGIGQGIFANYLITDDDAESFKKVRIHDDGYSKRR